MTRNDILANRAKIQAVIDKHKASSPDNCVDLTGLTLIDKALAKWRDGKPHVVLRNYNRILKYYLEQTFVWPDTVCQLDSACRKVHAGFTHDQAIRHARQVMRNARAMVNRIEETEQGKEKPTKPSNKHDRILEEILSI